MFISIKQYKPMKQIKRDYKIWAGSVMDEYMSKFSIYQSTNCETENPDVLDCFGQS